MKFIILALLVFPLIACHSSKKKYYIIIQQKTTVPEHSNLHNDLIMDSIMAENDSLAYWEGATDFIKRSKANKSINNSEENEENMQTEDFLVLDEKGDNIKEHLPKNYILKTNRFINRNK